MHSHAGQIPQTHTTISSQMSSRSQSHDGVGTQWASLTKWRTLCAFLRIHLRGTCRNDHHHVSSASRYVDAHHAVLAAKTNLRDLAWSVFLYAALAMVISSHQNWVGAAQCCRPAVSEIYMLQVSVHLSVAHRIIYMWKMCVGDYDSLPASSV